MPCTVLPVLVSFHYLEILSLPHYQFTPAEILTSHQVMYWRESLVIWLGFGLQFSHLPLLPSLKVFYQSIFMSCFLDYSLWWIVLLIQSWVWDSEAFSQTCLFQGGRSLPNITPLTIARRRWHMRCEGCRAAFLGPFACRADRLSCMVKAASQRETLPPPGWCWESRIKIAVAAGVFLGWWNYGHIILCICQKL